jgi:hypothetical protein
VIWFDHLLTGTIILVDPGYGAWTIARVIRQIASAILTLASGCIDR